VGGVDRVQIMVNEVTTRSSSSPQINAPSSIWPDISVGDDSYSSVFLKGDETSPRCALLIQDTEVIVSPKTRSRKKKIPWSRPLRLIPGDSDWGASLEKLSSLTKRKSFHVEPGFVLVHTDQWKFEIKWAQIKADDSDSNETRVVGVRTSSRIPQNNAVLFLGTRLDLGVVLYRDRICLRALISTREQSLESIALAETHLEDDRTGLSIWNVPDIDLAGCRDIYSPGWHYQNDPIILPVGAVIPMPSTHVGRKKIHGSSQWFRITSEEVHDCDEGRVVQLHTNDFLFLSKRSLPKRKESFTLTMHPHEMSSIQIPRGIIMSTNWMKQITERMEHFPSTVAILCGVSGSGKTHNALLLSALMSFSFHRPRLYLDCRKLQKSKPRMREIFEEIDSLFAQARESRNAIIILDDIDILSPNLLVSDENNMSARTHSVNPATIDQSKLICDRLLHLFEAANVEANKSGDCQFSLIATCSSPDSIHSSLLKSSQAPIIHAKVPHITSEDRANLLMSMIRQYHPTMRNNLDHSKISKITEGFIPRDCEKLCLRVIRSYRANSSITLPDSVAAELVEFTPLARISNSRPKDCNHTVWDDIGGLFDVKEKLEATVRHPVLYRRIYARAQIQLPRGILLYGPSGCGKSYLVPALAQECNYHLVTCKGPEILDKYIGASEAKVRQLFERASQMAPSILFLDELEALAPRRGSDSTGVTDRVVNQLLTFLDGVEDVSSGTVFIIGATSRPDKVDPAIIRPGRLEQHLYVGPPESTNEWSDLLLTISKQWNLTPELSRALSNGDEISKMASDVPRLCPADIRAAFDTAHLNAVHRTLAGETSVNDIEKIEIEMEDIKFGLGETKGSLSESEANMLEPPYNSIGGHIQADSCPKTAPGQKISLR